MLGIQPRTCVAFFALLSVGASAFGRADATETVHPPSRVDISPAAASRVSRCEQVAITAPSSNGDVRAIEALAPNYAWAVGGYKDAKGALLPWASHWDGAAWSDTSVAGSPQGALYGVAGTRGTQATFAVGYDGLYPMIQRWDGKAWSLSFEDEANGGSLYAVATDGPNDVWAVGGPTPEGYNVRPSSYHWDGTHWHRVHVPVPGGFTVGGLYSVVILSPSDVWAVGWAAAYFDDNSVSLSEHWDGQRWTGHLLFQKTRTDATLNALTTVPHDSSVWAVGENEVGDGPKPLQTIAARFTGRHWSVVRSPSPATFTAFNGIAALNASNIWAVGSEQQESGTASPLIEQWDGSAWLRVEGPPSQRPASLTSAATIPGTSRIWAAGYTINGSARTPLIEQCFPRDE